MFVLYDHIKGFVIGKKWHKTRRSSELQPIGKEEEQEGAIGTDGIEAEEG